MNTSYALAPGVVVYAATTWLSSWLRAIDYELEYMALTLPLPSRGRVNQMRMAFSRSMGEIRDHFEAALSAPAGGSTSTPRGHIAHALLENHQLQMDIHARKFEEAFSHGLHLMGAQSVQTLHEALHNIGDETDSIGGASPKAMAKALFSALLKAAPDLDALGLWVEAGTTVLRHHAHSFYALLAPMAVHGQEGIHLKPQSSKYVKTSRAQITSSISVLSSRLGELYAQWHSVPKMPQALLLARRIVITLMLQTEQHVSDKHVHYLLQTLHPQLLELAKQHPAFFAHPQNLLHQFLRQLTDANLLACDTGSRMQLDQLIVRMAKEATCLQPSTIQSWLSKQIENLQELSFVQAPTQSGEIQSSEQDGAPEEVPKAYLDNLTAAVSRKLASQLAPKNIDELTREFVLGPWSRVITLAMLEAPAAGEESKGTFAKSSQYLSTMADLLKYRQYQERDPMPQKGLIFSLVEGLRSIGLSKQEQDTWLRKLFDPRDQVQINKQAPVMQS